MRRLYSVSILLYGLAVRVASLFNSKASLWVNGRKDWRSTLRKEPAGNKWLWFHCASLGEFEQGRPVLERFRSEFPQWKIALTFFSPSGYEVRKNYRNADLVMYLPLDTPGNARDFVKMLNPSFAFFVKAEIWPNYFLELKRSKIPLYLISARFRPGQRFLQGKHGFWKSILSIPDMIFVQDEPSLSLLQNAGYGNAVIAGDTRFDRVLALASESRSLPGVEQFIGGRKAIVFGSCWPPEDEIAQLLLQDIKGPYCLIMVPHDVSRSHISYLRNLFSGEAIVLSEWQGSSTGEATSVLIVDSVGLLGSLYRMAHLAIVGGGFGSGLHNILEPAVYGVPVGFGGHHRRFPEARAMIDAGGAFDQRHPVELLGKILEMLQDEPGLRKMGENAGAFVQSNKGAGDRIWKCLKDRGVMDKMQKHLPET